MLVIQVNLREIMVIVVFKIVVLLVSLLLSISYLTLAERKVLGYIQCRKGANVVGVYGLLQPLADGLKLFTKEIIIPNHTSLKQYPLATPLHSNHTHRFDPLATLTSC